ncbi:hypothetical protein GGF32_002099 [Allomyces javanicus]|nr:hypothetical protein GGF32_002099 [Allomyces javanicus]
MTNAPTAANEPDAPLPSDEVVATEPGQSNGDAAPSYSPPHQPVPGVDVPVLQDDTPPSLPANDDQHQQLVADPESEPASPAGSNGASSDPDASLRPSARSLARHRPSRSSTVDPANLAERRGRATSAHHRLSFLTTDPARALGLRSGSAGDVRSASVDARSVHSYQSGLLPDTDSVTESLDATIRAALRSPSADADPTIRMASSGTLIKLLDESRLRDFLTLLPKLQQALEFKSPMHNLALLVKAELRYIIWLKLLMSLDPHGSEFLVPPFDVAFMWMIHLSDTKSYIQDVIRLGGENLLEWQFPLERLTQIAELGIDFVDSDSERVWHRFAPAEPYRYRYPARMDQTTLPFICPRCNTTCQVPAARYVRVRFGSDTVGCSRCQRGGVNIALWSAMLFLNDVRKVASEASLVNYQLKSTQLTANHTVHLETTRQLHDYLKAVRFDLQLQARLRMSPNRYWNDIYLLLRNTLMDSGLAHEEQNYFAASLMNSYGNVVSELSIDLVERAEHWIRLLNVVTTVTATDSWLATSDEWLSECRDRYLKLILLQGALCEVHDGRLAKARARDPTVDDAGPKLVIPTFDVLVAYHTHLLAPASYYQYSMANFRRILNFHYFTEEAMVQAYSRTRKLWKRRYRSEYDPHTHHPGYSSLLAKYRWRRLVKIGSKLVLLPVSMVVVGAVMLLTTAPSVGPPTRNMVSAAMAQANPVASAGAPGNGGAADGGTSGASRREAEVTGDFTPPRSRSATVSSAR